MTPYERISSICDAIVLVASCRLTLRISSADMVLPAPSPTAMSSMGSPWQSQPGVDCTRRPWKEARQQITNPLDMSGWWEPPSSHTLLDLGPEDHVFENLVQRMSHVQAAVGGRGAGGGGGRGGGGAGGGRPRGRG